ncbi:hypothetical protein EDB89DRAFT_796281 [Lactarius sanguifluus]|nr:hypothetical protein EDB89DRAFT_796281 [Lactarius sanguifluus]
MPRYRRRAVEAMSDNIEEDDDATQNQEVDAVDADEDEDLQPRRPRRTQSRVVRGAPRETPVPERDEPDDAQDVGAVFDEDAFGNKPLNRNDGQRLHGMAADWDMIRKHLKESAFSLLTEVSTAVAEYADEDNSEKELDRLDGFMRELIDIDTEIRSHEQTLNDLHQQVVTGEEISDILEHYQVQVQEKLDAHNTKTSRQKYAKSEAYAAFRQSIYEVQHPNEAMPPVVEFLPREEGDHSDDDEDDIQVGGVLQDINCPITLIPLVDPQTSWDHLAMPSIIWSLNIFPSRSICQHSFSAQAIRQMLGPNRFTKKKCPASGCNQMICLNDLESNKELERKVKAYQRRAQRREEDQDAEEIVE